MTKLNKENILSILKENKNNLRQFGVLKIGLFGSYIRNESTDLSDIDFIVEFEEGKKNYDNFITLTFFLEKLFKKEVDLLTLDSLSPYIKPYILREVKYEAIKEL